MGQRWRTGTTAGLALLIAGALLLAACGLPETRSKAAGPGLTAQERIGLVVSETIVMDAGDNRTALLSPTDDSTSRYLGRIEPGGFPLAFLRDGAGRVYVAWIFSDILPPAGQGVEIVISGHEIIGPGGRFKTVWPAEDLVRIPVKTTPPPGRAIYLGMLVRRVAPPLEKGEPDVLKSTLTYRKDPEERGLAATWLDDADFRRRLWPETVPPWLTGASD